MLNSSKLAMENSQLTLTTAPSHLPYAETILIMARKEELGSQWALHNVQAAMALCAGVTVLAMLAVALTRNNFLYAMLAVEMTYLGIITGFVLYATMTTEWSALMYALVIAIAAACESALGLGILITMFRFERRIEFSSYNILGG